MEDVLITYKASRNIIKQSKLCPVETGGILVGTLSPLTIVAAGSPGENAVHEAARFTSDPNADRACLTDARKQHGSQVGLVGWWHKHPLGLTTPSSGDRYQARQLAKEYNDGQPVLMGIVNRHPKLVRHKTILHLYSIDPAGNLAEHDWKLIGGRSKELLDAIGRAPIRPDLKPTDYWTDKDFQSYLNPIGRERINDEVQNLRKKGWAVKVGRRTSDHSLVLDMREGSSVLRCVLPPEFPLNPPTVFTADGRQFVELRALRGWNSHFHLIEVAAEAVSVMSCGHCSERCIEKRKDEHI
jgi:proteasome lid subunit RPN8/RPN11